MIAKKTPRLVFHWIYFLQQVLYIWEVVPLAAKPRSSLVWRLFYWQPALPVDQWGAFMSLLSRSSHSVELCPPRCLRRWYPRYDGNLKSEKELSLNRTFPQPGSVKWQQLPAISARKCWMPVPAIQHATICADNEKISNYQNWKYEICSKTSQQRDSSSWLESVWIHFPQFHFPQSQKPPGSNIWNLSLMRILLWVIYISMRLTSRNCRHYLSFSGSNSNRFEKLAQRTYFTKRPWTSF